MYEYARRLMSSSHHAESAKLLLTEASETYLAAINTLHLSGSDSAWVTISSTGYGPDEVSKISFTRSKCVFRLLRKECRAEELVLIGQLHFFL